MNIEKIVGIAYNKSVKFFKRISQITHKGTAASGSFALSQKSRVKENRHGIIFLRLCEK